MTEKRMRVREVSIILSLFLTSCVLYVLLYSPQRVIVNAAIWLGNDTANFKEGEDVRCSNLSIKAKATYIK